MGWQRVSRPWQRLTQIHFTALNRYNGGAVAERVREANSAWEDVTDE